MDYKFELPWPPSVNSLRACVRNRLITTKRGRDYFALVSKKMDKLGLSGEGIADRVVIGIMMHPPTLRKYDVSNFLKAYEDALVKCGFIDDDHLIEYSFIGKGEKIKGGKLDISVTVLAVL